MDCNSYKRNAYGFANMMIQAAILKPKIKNKILQSFIYAGRRIVPAPGIYLSIIFGDINSRTIIEIFND